MRPALATVISPRPWEPRLVSAVRSTGLVRLVGRFTDPVALAGMEPTVDVVAFDTTAPWLSHELVRRWQSRSIVTVGFAPDNDRVADRVLGACDLVFHEDDAPGRVLAALVASAPPPAPPSGYRSPASVVPVVGARGAPGCTEISIALAMALAPHGPTLLTESDPAAPGVGTRLALPPGPRPCDWHGIEVLQCHPERSTIVRVLERSTTGFSHVVIDAGVGGLLGPGAATPVLVVEPSATGTVRAATLVRDWTSPEPILVMNRAPAAAGDREAALRRVRAATGLEPVAVVDEMAVGWPGPPPQAMVEQLLPAAGLLDDQVEGALR